MVDQSKTRVGRSLHSWKRSGYGRRHPSETSLMKTIHHVVDMPARVDDVFAAVTTQDGLSGWWTTSVDVPAVEEGEVIQFTFGGDFNPSMEITAIEPPHRVDWRCVGGHEEWADNTFRFDVADLGDGRCRLRFWQHYAVELEDDYYGTYNYNWGYYLQSLHELVTTGTGKPFQV